LIFFSGFAINIPQHFVYRVEPLTNVFCFHHGAGRFLRRDAYPKREALSRYNLTKKKSHGITDAQAENEKSPASVNLQGFSVRLTISLSPADQTGLFGWCG
jgi:hypothetical protein